jgi:Domain of unknown function (DUF4292)
MKKLFVGSRKSEVGSLKYIVRKYSLLILVSAIVFSGCKTAKNISKPVVDKIPNPVVQVIEQVQKNQPQFKTANVSKMALELQLGERKVNVSATCKIKNDSALFLSIQPFLGIEMFKAEFTSDSIKIFDKMNMRYYATDYSYFRNQFGVAVDFQGLQSLLTARFFCVEQKNISTDSCKLIVSMPSGNNIINFETKNMIQKTEIDQKNSIQQITLTTKKSNYQLQTTYSDYLLENGFNFPQKISLKIRSPKTTASCDFSILKVIFNTDIKFIPTSSERFTHANLDQLFKK